MKKSLLWLITGFVVLTGMTACAPVPEPVQVQVRQDVCDKLCSTRPSNWNNNKGREDFIALVEEAKAEYKINAKDTEGRTALHYAAKHGHPEAVRILLDAGAEVDIEAKKYKRPLHYAVEGSNAGAIKLLLDAGAEISIFMIHTAAKNNSPESIKALVDGGADVDTRYGNNENDDTPLHTATSHGKLEALKGLIDLGADVNAKTWRGTPLHKAAKLKYKAPEAIKALLAAGADVNAEARHKVTPLHMAARGSRNNPERVKILVAAGAHVNARDSDGKTPLHEAAKSGRPKIIEALIAAGADIEAKSDGYTALHFAAGADLSSVSTKPSNVKALLAAGANVNSRIATGQTPLTIAIWKRQLGHKVYDATIRYLREAGGVQ